MAKKATEGSVLTTTAKAIGATAGKIAALTGIAEPAPRRPKAAKPAKLVKKNKPHLPRREKKAQKKAALAAAEQAKA